MTASTAPRQIEMALPDLLAATHLAERRGDASLGRELTDLIQAAAQRNARKHKAVARLLELAQSGMQEAILPFAADPLTAWAAALSFPRGTAGSFRLFSSDAIVDLGYFLCDSNGVRYVDSAIESKGQDEIPVFPMLGIGAEALARLEAADCETPRASFAPGAGDKIVLHIDPTESEEWVRTASRARVMLLRAGDDANFVHRDLGPLPIAKGEHAELRIELSGERQLEMHAASFAGAWMLVEAERRSLLARVPDLNPEVPAVTARMTRPSFGLPIPFSANRNVAVPEPLALQLLQRHWWIAPGYFETWFELARAIDSPQLPAPAVR